ncbi:hypothetical protein [Reichenbachiella sp. MSK19-1]|uniref:hypothetical protein n=1 Tax=Reichenbachiella sp. MSK19-1 TaxID=1897631 RepID=UPI000E6C7B1B|nr:hypothetical protein [Reichenbachiella sp. MSK19-1]RJE71628.1 hypothetical protein BGP76_05940 [Reichenbachiella sp. MSK19-1]
MFKNRCLFLVLLCTLGTHLATAQYFGFASQPDSFAIDVVRNLRGLHTEQTNKIAYDFRNIWDSQINDEQKASIIAVCEKMDERRLSTRPYYTLFFSVMTHAHQQEGLTGDQFSGVLDICHQAVDLYGKEEIITVYKNLAFFFAQGSIYHSHYNKVMSTGGSFTIALMEETVATNSAIPTEEDLVEEPVEEEFITEEDLAPVADDTANDGWASDDWGSEGSDDGWGDDDGWGSDDGWGADDSSWDSPSDDGFLEDDQDYKEEKVYERKNYAFEKPDLVALAQSNDYDPVIGGPVIKVEGMEFKIATPYDTLTIKDVSGSFMLKTQEFVGTSGTVDWPDDLQGTDGAVVELKGYSFKTNIPRLKTTRAEMKYPEMFDGSVLGEFYFKSGKRNKRAEKNYPVFTSLKSDVVLKLPGKNVQYLGGFAMRGAKKYGRSISKELSTLEVSGAGDRRFVSKSYEYIFEDSLVSAKRSSIVIHHRSDSIYHPVVGMTFDAGVPKLTLIKDDGGYRHTYYYSSFFKIEFQADMVDWNLDSSSLDVSILNAANRVPALFESEEYFNPIRYKKMTGLFGFHPIMLVVQYARKVQDSKFNLLELVDAYEIELSLAEAAAVFLEQNQYITYDQESGQVQVLRKAFHYQLAYNGKKDYDNFLISSVAPQGGSNATLNFDEGKMGVRGVKRVYITPDTDVFIEPDSSVLTLTKDKGMLFDGMVNAGDFRYSGKEMVLNYNEYLVEMPRIDSINIQVELAESKDHEKTQLNNHLEMTSGTLYINHPKNKAGLRKFVQYPYFVSKSEAIVYFDSKDVLGGAYDRSVYFVVPPFEMDSINRGDAGTIGFEGTFYSGGIIPPIKEKLSIMPDKSLGFSHEIPAEGYQLYKGEGVLYDDLTLNADGLRADGRIDFRTATVNSDDFIFYMDSVSAVGQEGLIRDGKIGDASYPEAVLAGFKMLWRPLKDSMYIENTGDPFQFYNATASLDGKANITLKGVFGSGEMLSRGSRSVSQEFQFSQTEYLGRHAEFEILTDNPDKPAMAGEDIDLHFDLVDNIANLHPEEQGVAAISFPFAQMKTSIPDAVWYLDSAKVVMSKPDYIDIEDSYFYTTREDLDSLAFSATEAIYNMNSYDLNIKGIPYIRVADVEIIPDNNETTILENSVLQPFNNAKLQIDTLNQYHNLYDGNLTVISRKKFEGSATYQYTNAVKDTFAIKFEKFELKGVPTLTSGKVDSMTVSGGVIPETQNFRVSPGFFFKGDVTMYANQRSLEKKGYITLDSKSQGRYNYWISYNTPGDTADVEIDIAQSLTEDGVAVTAGIMRDELTSDLYMAFVRDRQRLEDDYFFQAEGILSYDLPTNEFRIQMPNRRKRNGYAGKSFVLNDETQELKFDGPIDLIKNKPEFNLMTSMLGEARPDSNQYSMDALMGIHMDLHKDVMSAMTVDVQDIIERLGPDVAHDNSLDLMIKLSNVIGDKSTKEYENSLLADYKPLYKLSEKLVKSILISNVDLTWSAEHRAWYNTSRIGISNFNHVDINAEAEGFLEIKKDDEGGDILHLFFQFAPSTWYFFSYQDGRLMMFSSNDGFNNLVAENSTVAKTGFGAYTTVVGDEFEVTGFINGFRGKYYDIHDDYNLEFPDDAHLEHQEDAYETIEEEASPEEQPYEEGAADTFEEVYEEEEPSEEPPVKKEEEEDDGF